MKMTAVPPASTAAANQGAAISGGASRSKRADTESHFSRIDTITTLFSGWKPNRYGTIWTISGGPFSFMRGRWSTAETVAGSRSSSDPAGTGIDIAADPCAAWGLGRPTAVGRVDNLDSVVLGTTVVGPAPKQAHAVGVDPTPEESKRPLGRRIVLGVVGLGAIAVVFGEPIQRAVDAVLSPVRRVDATGLTDLIPGEGGWRYYSVTARQPSITTAEYQLQVDGLVDRPRTFTWDDLEQQPQTHWTHDFQCVTGWRVQGVMWQGVQLRQLLHVVGLKSAATAFRFYSHDGTYTESLTREQVEGDEVMVATHL